MIHETANNYYRRETWDVRSWVDVIAIEYEKLSTEYPFNQKLNALTAGGSIRLLDIGCGTAIFPGFLDAALDPDIILNCDLFDISESSLSEARRVISGLSHFEVGKSYQGLIEDIPTIFGQHPHKYDVIWAIHSFSTVDIDKMQAVYSHLLQMLAGGGLLLVYQLSRDSSYQFLHGYYRNQHPNGKRVKAYMEYEDSAQILDSLGAAHTVMQLNFSHKIDENRPELLEKYLQKIVLDDDAAVLEIFSPILAQFYVPEDKKYIFPQTVNLLEVYK